METEQRLERIERQNQSMKLGFAVVLIIALFGLFLSGWHWQVEGPRLPYASPSPAPTTEFPDVIKARKIQIVDDSGVVVIDLAVDPKGDGTVVIKNGDGRPFLGLSSIAGSGNILALGHDSQVLASLGGDADGNGRLGLYNKDGKPRVTLSADGVGGSVVASAPGPNGGTRVVLRATTSNGLLWLFGRNEELLASVGADANGNGMLIVNNRDGKPRVTLNAAAESGAMTIVDGGTVSCGHDGKLLAALSASSAGGFLDTISSDGKDLVALGPDANGNGRVTLFNKDGKDRVTLVASDKGGRVGTSNGHLMMATLAATELGGNLMIGNSDGKPLVDIGVVGINQAGKGGVVTTLDRDGRPLVMLGVESGGGMVTTFNREGKPIVSLQTSVEGGGLFGIYNREGKSLALLTAGPGRGMLMLNMEDNRGRVEIDGQGSVSIHGGVPGSGFLTVKDRDGKERTIRP